MGFSLFFLLICFAIHKTQSASFKDRQLSPVSDHCPNGSVRHDQSCYLFSHLLANWPESMVYCQAYGAHLAFIESDREQKFIQAQVFSTMGSQTDPLKFFWLGGTDAVSEGEWFWANIVEPITYTNWNPGEPNNDNNHDDHHQDCLAMYSSSGLWDDGYCEVKHNFICEIELNSEVPIVG
ncbi:galactose-specific lectin nattectin-like [Dreissena polymorpha]|uniref:C-type lectin domain-containing protein n=1 Tax=Dreissena polymorpha TaxID=45954 RepID=A0A9D4QUF3_DREPO|nr:galactose-specific lectin nattectin-like [Dreissena polymorpha]KAH3843092.1 hypothetical protein DPMN_116599 [Dreissena polymorpha]